MIEAVFLCDTDWKINRVRQCGAQFGLKEGIFLTDLVSEKEELKNQTESHTSLELTFLKEECAIPALIDNYKDGRLVILAKVQNQQEFIEVSRECRKYQEWANDCLMGLYHDEYFLIQQINNQLVDMQRRLSRTNRRLEDALREKQAMNEELEQAREAAEEANRSKTRFLANMSHDIRTPMNAIVGLTELMRHSLTDPEGLKNYLSKLQSSSRYLLDLINDILDLSKIENGSSKLKPEPMDLGAQIEQVVTIIRPQINRKKQNLSVQSDCQTFGPLLGDPVRFRQILMNLFSNAVKYTPEGGNIRFLIHSLEAEPGKQGYRFVVEDSGIGMSEAFIQHIFEPFSRAEAEVKEIQGTGLGMAITKNIVDAMGGEIRVSSILGKGSRFELDLSFEICAGSMEEERQGKESALSGTESRAESGANSRTEFRSESEENSGPESRTESEVKSRMEPASGRSPARRRGLRGRRFLCAEDNELNAEILSSMLELEGAECEIYNNGKELVEAFETVKPGQYDAILMDIQMPVMDGYEAARQIRESANSLGKEIPVIAMTANAFSEDIERCLEAGMNAHIAKPIDMKVLIQTLEEI